MLINEKPSVSVVEFLANYSKTQKIDTDIAKKQISALMKYKGADRHNRDELAYFIKLEKQWYGALEKGEIDYSVYDADYYFTNLWACWCIYSRSYLKEIVKPKSLNTQNSIYSYLKQYKSVVDLGCGIGHTTAALTQLFEGVDIYGTNLKDTKQFEYCKYMSGKYEFNLVTDIREINRQVDLVFASEYFEHIENTLEHLTEVIVRLRPKCLIIANAFNTRSVGHFIYYKVKGKSVPQRNIARMFHKVLVLLGYDKVKTRMWNQRPSVWVNRYANKISGKAGSRLSLTAT